MVTSRLYAAGIGSDICCGLGFTFAAYGQLLAVHGTTGEAVPATAALTSLGYSGEHFDVEAEQQYLRARWYDPANGRFNRLDPFAGNMQDPQSLHKYAYVHGDPVTFVDPTGLFVGLTGMLSGLGSQANLRAQNQSASVGTKVHATSRIREIAHLYQKCLRIFHNIYDKYQDLMDLIDILDFDPRSIQVIVGQFAAEGFNEALDAGPTVVKSVSVRMPPAMMQRMKKVWDFFFRMGLGHQKVQEILGELATGVVIKALGYDLPPLSLDAVHGPDQVAKHTSSGFWGIFEAKGGTATLGTQPTNMGGPQMSGAWITGWIQQLIRNNSNTTYGRELRDSFNRGDVMLAAVTRLRVFNRPGGRIDATFEAVAQKYEADESGRNMRPWGTGW